MTGFGLIMLLGGILFLLGFLVLYWKVGSFRQQPVLAPIRDAGIILGAALHRDQPSPALRERLDYALQLYRKGHFTTFLCCGGACGRQISEAAVMRTYLVERGVPASAILVEDRSVNTEQNLAYARPILIEHQMKTCLLITHDYHMYRAWLHAKRQGIDAIPAPCSSRHLWLPYHRTRECLALLRWFLLRR
jgi:uncharacterized SAM-binding protein YcdF (DUF218 family)